MLSRVAVMGGPKNFDKRGSILTSADQSAAAIDGLVSEALIDKLVSGRICHQRTTTLLA